MIEKIDFDICRMYDGGWVIIGKNFDRLFANNQSQGLARFYDDKGGAWVNSTGNPITDKRYKDVGNFIQGFARFQDDKGQGYCNFFGFEFRSIKFRWDANTAKENFENNKKELLELEEKLYGFPRSSMKYYILTKVLT